MEGGTAAEETGVCGCAAVLAAVRRRDGTAELPLTSLQLLSSWSTAAAAAAAASLLPGKSDICGCLSTAEANFQQPGVLSLSFTNPGISWVLRAGSGTSCEWLSVFWVH